MTPLYDPLQDVDRGWYSEINKNIPQTSNFNKIASIWAKNI